MMYFLVKCKLVTTPWSGAICLAVIWPPFFHADSTKYLCLKCILCVDFALGLLLLRDDPVASEQERLDVLSDLSGIVYELSTARLGEGEEGGRGP